jgi:hypothetical protein
MVIVAVIQIEEEEYTSRIIQYFSTGLLTLPDGATLRSYLAEKLNCDPMRITKKFTGACCLGRRAYHLRDRPRASPTEMEIARLELQHLENRFRLRVEHEQSGLPLPTTNELLPAQPPVAFPSIFASLQGASAVNNPWIANAAPSAVLSNQFSVAPTHGALLAAAPGNLAFPGANIPLVGSNPQLSLSSPGQLLLQSINDRYGISYRLNRSIFFKIVSSHNAFSFRYLDHQDATQQLCNNISCCSSSSSSIQQSRRFFGLGTSCR